jgi:2-C-methyl-D-erythritol 4-phosphate cytidylyltransferase
VKIRLVIPAAGMGCRLGNAGPKALINLAGSPLVIHTLRRFDALDIGEPVVLACPPDHGAHFADALGAAYPGRAFRLISGGAERQDSVRVALDALEADTDLVIIHDAARPFIERGSIEAAIDAAAEYGAATVAVPVTDTILEEDGAGFLAAVPDRSVLWACQTPQVFRKDIIVRAHAAALQAGFSGTDDASLVKWHGGPVRLITGSARNLKITTPADRRLAEILLREEKE